MPANADNVVRQIEAEMRRLRDPKARKEYLEAVVADEEENVARLGREVNAADALMGDYIERKMQAFPQSPAIVMAELLMTTSLDPDRIEACLDSARRRGYLWPGRLNDAVL
jgi:hypothetical protein